ncbi:hypothetical protein V8C37DRAFT_396849 [Trichoderma ceciliae]
MGYEQMSIHSRITGSSPPAERNSTSEVPTSTSSHDYIPIIVITVIIMTIIVIIVLLSQYTNVLNRKKTNEGADDPENAQNASKIEKLDRVAPIQTYRIWKEKSENASNSVKQGTTFVVCVICLETLQDNDAIRLLPCAHIFHSLCLARWFLKRHDTCPLCKARFMNSSEKPPNILRTPERARTR